MSASVNPTQARDAMRRMFKEKADSILKGLKSKSKGSYGRPDLRELGVSFEHVQISERDGPENQQFPDFKPLSLEEFKKYRITESTLPEDRRQRLNGFEAAFNYSPPVQMSEGYVMYERAFQIFRLIGILYSWSKKRNISMEEKSKWYQIR